MFHQFDSLPSRNLQKSYRIKAGWTEASSRRPSFWVFFGRNLPVWQLSSSKSALTRLTFILGYGPFRISEIILQWKFRCFEASETQQKPTLSIIVFDNKLWVFVEELTMIKSWEFIGCMIAAEKGSNNFIIVFDNHWTIMKNPRWYQCRHMFNEFISRSFWKGISFNSNIYYFLSLQNPLKLKRTYSSVDEDSNNWRNVR